MFLRLLDHGARARAAGNYGIAAAYVVRSEGTEIVCFGENSVFSEQDPTGHAELNSLRLARRIAGADRGERDRLLGNERCVLLRDAPHDRFETLLYSTLEPCPMCTVAIINANVERVFVAHADPPAGALLHLDRLPPLWGDFATERELEVVKATDEGSDGVVPGELADLLNRLFLDGKDELDRRLTADGLLPAKRLAAVVRSSRLV